MAILSPQVARAPLVETAPRETYLNFAETPIVDFEAYDYGRLPRSVEVRA